MSFCAGPFDWVSAIQPIKGSNEMQYLLLIYRNDAEYGKMGAAERKQMSAEYGVFTQAIVQSGHFKAGDGLQPTTTATTVRVRDGKTLTTDGPFAETREQLGGYYLVEAKDLDTALAIAARIPGAKTGSRSEERRVGKECRARGSRERYTKAG